MPGVDGLNLLRQYRADVVTKDTPVIVLSSKEDPVIKSEAFSAGASDHLVKLPDRVELAARIRLHSRPASINCSATKRIARCVKVSSCWSCATRFDVLARMRDMTERPRVIVLSARGLDITPMDELRRLSGPN